jgi:hypothetical protein
LHLYLPMIPYALTCEARSLLIVRGDVRGRFVSDFLAFEYSRSVRPIHSVLSRSLGMPSTDSALPKKQIRSPINIKRLY